MTITILLSGPSTSSNQLRTALAGAGFAHVVEAFDTGLSDGTATRWTGDTYTEDVYDDSEPPDPLHAVGDIIPGTGDIEAIEPDFPVGFVRCEGDVNQAADIAVGFGWVLRAHQEYIEEAIPVDLGELSRDERLARVERDLVILKGGDV